MKEIFKQVIPKIKSSNTRCFLEGVVKENQNQLSLKIDGNNSDILNMAYGLDRTIVIKQKKIFNLYRMEEIIDDEVNLSLISEVKSKKIFNINYLNFCEFRLVMPIISLQDQLLLPLETNCFVIGTEKSKQSLNLLVQKSSKVFLTRSEDGQDQTYQQGVIADVSKIKKMDDDNYEVCFEGLYRASIKKYLTSEGESQVELNLKFENYSTPGLENYQQNCFMKLNELKKACPEFNIPSEKLNSLINTQDTFKFIFILLTSLSLKINTKFLAMQSNLLNLYEIILNNIEERIQHIQLEIEINNKVKKELNEKNKLLWIKQKIKALKKALDESEPNNDEDMRNKNTKEDEKNYPQELKEYIENLKNTKKGTVGHTLDGINQVLNLIYSMPWTKIKNPEKKPLVIQEKLKESYALNSKIISQLIKKINLRNDDGKGKILAFVGPPGIGKTTLAKAYAESFGLDFKTISCAGISDSSEFIGHNRTYVASQPGSIIKALASKEIKSTNPIIVLDEFDKMNRDSGKNPYSVFYNILDTTNNDKFRDVFLDFPVDLSKITWILTMNDLSRLDRIILDRIQIIEMDGYTPEEKRIISQKLISRIQSNLKLKDDEFKFTPSAIDYIINNYTREQGVRRLNQLLEIILQEVVFQIDVHNKTKITIDQNFISTTLEGERKKQKQQLIIRKPGEMQALGYNEYSGGSLLNMQTILIDRKPSLEQRLTPVFTGNIKKIMEESLKVCLSLLKQNYQKFNINIDDIYQKEIHCHILDGATPKDGPSAGVALYLMLLSAYTKTPINNNLFTTGEISLLGEVLPVGGIKQKLEAVKQYAKNTKSKCEVFLSVENMEDVQKILANNDTTADIKIKNKKQVNINDFVTIIFAKHIDEIIPKAFPETDC